MSWRLSLKGGSEDGSDSSSEGSNDKLNVLLSSIDHIIKTLLRLSPTISNPAPHDRFKSRAGAELIHQFEHYDTQHVRAMYPHINLKVSDRLSRMLTNRRKYFKYREAHHSRLEQGLGGKPGGGANKESATTRASSLPQEWRDAPQQIPAMIIDDQSEISTTSYASSTLDGKELSVPPIPKQHADGPFLCPFCYVFIYADSRDEWKSVYIPKLELCSILSHNLRS